MSTVLHPAGQSIEPASNESMHKGSGETVVKFGVVGYGYWGPNVVRNLDQLDGSEVVAVCDKSPTARKRIHKSYPHIKVVSDTAELMSSTDIDAVAIVTPVWSHYELTKAALENGKHVFVEKPFTSDSGQAEELINLAAKKNLKIMVDHTFLFTGAVKKIGQLLDEGTLGKLYYYDAVRVNLGLFQHDINVLWDLAVHDLSIMDFLLPEAPCAVSATGIRHVADRGEDIAYLTLFFPSDLIAHIHVNWLAPVKVRRTLIGGTEKMVVYDDVEASEKVKVYDKGITLSGDPAEQYQMRI